MKKLFTAFLFLLLMLSSCRMSSTGPESTVNSFFTAAKILDTETMAGLVNPAKIEVIGRVKEFLVEDEQNPLADVFAEYFRKAASEMTYNIVETEIDEDKSLVVVDCFYVDPGVLFMEVFDAYCTRLFSMTFEEGELDEQKLQQETAEALATDNLSADADSIFTMSLVKIDDEWYLDNINEDLWDILTAGFTSAVAELSTRGSENADD